MKVKKSAMKKGLMKSYLMGFIQAQKGNGKDDIDVRFNLISVMRDHDAFKHLEFDEMNALIDEVFTMLKED